MKTSGIVVALGVACLASALDAQETGPRGVVSPDKYGKYTGKPAEEVTTGSFFLRLSTLEGELEGGDAGSDWNDAWNNGMGLGFELTWLMPVSRQVLVGPYGAVTFDIFQGKEIVDEDPLGNETLEFDPLMTARIVFGLASRQSFGRIFLEERLGVGGGFIFENDYDFSDPFTSSSGTVFEATLVATFEARIAAGFQLGEASAFVMGVGFESMGAPDSTDDATSFFDNVNFKRKESLVFTLAFCFDF